MLEKITDGRTDLVFDYLAAGHAANATDRAGVSLIQWCAYFGDVSAMKFLLANGASLDALGENLGLNGACFHGHWRLCQFLIERGADVNLAEETGETPMHSALCKGETPLHRAAAFWGWNAGDQGQIAIMRGRSGRADTSGGCSAPARSS